MCGFKEGGWLCVGGMHLLLALIIRYAAMQENVVRREKVAVLTQGTLTDHEMLEAQPDASYLLALAELPVPGGWVGGWVGG